MSGFELFSVGPGEPDAVWAVASDLRRLPDWTDADSVENLPDGEPAVGDTFTTVVGASRLNWTVLTVERRLLEAITRTGSGSVAVGVRVLAGQEGGTRVVLAGRVSRQGRLAKLRSTLVAAPALRRRMDRWAHDLLQAAG